MEKLSTSDVSISNDNIYVPDRKINSCSKFAIKLFPATFANAECSKFYQHVVKILIK